MSHGAIPQPVLAELAAAYAVLMRHREQGCAVSVTLRLSVDRNGQARLKAELWDGLTAQALAAKS